MAERDTAFDFMKGVAIVLMVLAHAMEPHCYWLRRWIYVFHMPVFFVCAGWFYNRASMAKFLQKKIIRLWWPYVLWTGLFILCHNFFLKINVYTDNPQSLEAGINELTMLWTGTHYWANLWRLPFLYASTQLSRACWFLAALFFASVFYNGVSRILCRACPRSEFLVQTCIGLALLIVVKYFRPSGWLHWVIGFVGGVPTLVAYALFHIGVLLRKYNLDVRRLGGYWMVILNLAALIGLIVQSRIGRVELGAGEYTSVTLLLGGTICGWVFLLTLSKIIAQYGGVFSYLGRHTMPVLLFHFLSFKLVTWIAVAMRGDPFYVIAGFPTYYHGIMWAIAYSVVGILLPLLIYLAFNWLKIARWTGLQ